MGVSFISYAVRIVHFTQINLSHKKSWQIDVGSKFTDRHKKNIKTHQECTEKGIQVEQN